MPDPLFAIAVLAAATCAGGIWLVISGLLPRHVRLGDALGLLAGESGQQTRPAEQLIMADPASRLEQAGAWLYQRARVPLPAATHRALLLHGRSVGDYMVNKLVLALGGLALPSLLSLALGGLGGSIPVGVGIVLGIVGWFWPDLTLRKQQAQTDADAAEALNTYFDLVALERLANRSATQAMEAAAQCSDVPVFLRLRATLEQARLEQRAPWTGLHRLSTELNLPAIADMADVMRLDEQGAALADALNSRVKELRDAHLMVERTQAHQSSERMTLWMSLPVIIFAVAFLVPPLLTMSAS